MAVEPKDDATRRLLDSLRVIAAAEGVVTEARRAQLWEQREAALARLHESARRFAATCEDGDVDGAAVAEADIHPHTAELTQLVTRACDEEIAMDAEQAATHEDMLRLLGWC